ncbi:MAG: DNRLRE domain-containing protein [Caldilineaceae bacterium]
MKFQMQDVRSTIQTSRSAFLAARLLHSASIPLHVVLVLTILSSLLAAFHPVAYAAADQTQASITIDADADTFVNSQQASTPYGTDRSIVVSEVSTVLAVQERGLLHFDLSKIPTGSIINKAGIRLYQTSATGDWLLNIDRIIESWDEPTVTFRTAPKVEVSLSNLDAPVVTNQYVSWDITNLVRQWIYLPGTYPNYGLQLRGNGVVGSALARVFESREATNVPQLVIDYTPPPTSLTIPFDAAAVKLDAQCSESEYSNAYNAQYLDIGGYVGTLYLKQDNDFVYACIMGARGSFSLRSFGLYLDRDFGQEKYAEAEDYWLQAFVALGQSTSHIGTGDSANPYTSAIIEDWSAVAVPGVVLGNTTTPDVAEFQLPLSMVSTTCGNPFGLALYHQDITDNGVNFGFPTRVGPPFPDTWVRAILERPNCPIRVCQQTLNACAPASNAKVYDAASDTSYSVDAQGYVQNRSQIADGTPLWAVLPVEQTTDYTRYDTSGDPQFVGASALNAGEMVLVVTPQRPLQVQNLRLSTEWYVEGDSTKRDWLAEQLKRASDYLYKFTDRQFALGTITVEQSLDGWNDTQIRVHSNNVFQPRAVIGGIVPTTTIDPSPVVTVTYSPGQINIGSYWNRYGKPPGQPILVNNVEVNPATLQDDWSLAMAHELGHYLFFLFDSYLTVDGKQTDSCIGSAMGDTYNPLNHGYIFSPDLWQTNCKQTIAYDLLHGRDEWDTIQAWYNWIQPPSAVLSGTIRPPVNLTTVTFIPPSNSPGAPASGNIFQLGYQGGETASGEARAFIYRDGRLLEQGKPAKGSTQLELLGPEVTDRLCVYDINDHSEGSETPRHQFGCEQIVPNDTTLTMTRNNGWSPLVSLTQSGSNVLQMVVAQTVVGDAPVRAILYPEYEQAISSITLTPVNGQLQGSFVLTQPVPPAYVQLFVDEATSGDQSQREVVFDRGTGGGGAFGPARFSGGVSIVASDGNASYEPDHDIELKDGESISWQSMPGTPPLPFGDEILGQSYRLDAFPANLVEDGTVKIQFEQSSASTPSGEVAIYFWDGQGWQKLPTVITVPVAGFHSDGIGGADTEAQDDQKLASTPSQGVGVYAVLMDNQQRLYLPLLSR